MLSFLHKSLGFPHINSAIAIAFFKKNAFWYGEEDINLF